MSFNSETKENIAKRVHHLNDVSGNWSIDFDDDYISIRKLGESIIVISINGPMLFSNGVLINSHEASIIFDMLQEFTWDVEQHRESKEDTFI